jgi:DNA modification methylase
MSVRILTGDALEVLKTLPDESVHCCVTSPPYWGLRDYATAGQLGLERTIAEYVEALVAVFAETRRVLRNDGTLWLNLGDTYSQVGGPGWQGKNGQRADRRFTAARDAVALRNIGRRPAAGLKVKDLCGIPWRVAFALQADGWYLRQDIIWAKPNPMPESVRDRPTKAHEYLFLLAKSQNYYYDAGAIKEPASPDTHERYARARHGSYHPPGQKENRGACVSPRKKTPSGWDKRSGSGHRDLVGRYPRKAAPSESGIKNNESFDAAMAVMPEDRNKRSVWTVPTLGYSGAHFATFPPALIEPCILAGCPVGGTVLDPFGGAGTSGLVADRLQRNAILIELNPKYVKMAEKRIHNDGPMFASVQCS